MTYFRPASGATKITKKNNEETQKLATKATKRPSISIVKGKRSNIRGQYLCIPDYLVKYMIHVYLTI